MDARVGVKASDEAWNSWAPGPLGCGINLRFGDMCWLVFADLLLCNAMQLYDIIWRCVIICG